AADGSIPRTDAEVSAGRLSVGVTLTEIFRAYRDHAGPLLTVAAVIFLPLTLLTEILNQSNVAFGMGASLVFSGPAAFLYAAAVAPVAASSAATDHSPGELWSKAAPLTGRLVLAGLLYALATSLGIILFIVPGL